MKGFVMVFSSGEILTYSLRDKDNPKGWTLQSALRAVRSFRHRSNYYGARLTQAGICPDFRHDTERWNEIRWLWKG